MGDYAKRLSRRMRSKRAEERTAKDIQALGGTQSRVKKQAGLSTEEIAAIGDVHPGRYPEHEDPRKGQVYGGECNTTACTSRRAVFFNQCTYGLYCPVCARGQNGQTGHRRPDPVPICVPVEEKPSLEKMNEMYRAYMKAYQAAQAA